MVRRVAECVCQRPSARGAVVSFLLPRSRTARSLQRLTNATKTHGYLLHAKRAINAHRFQLSLSVPRAVLLAGMGEDGCRQWLLRAVKSDVLRRRHFGVWSLHSVLSLIPAVEGL